jgi:hypothetical protein
VRSAAEGAPGASSKAAKRKLNATTRRCSSEATIPIWAEPGAQGAQEMTPEASRSCTVRERSQDLPPCRERRNEAEQV